MTSWASCKKHIEQGEQIGPRIVLAGFIDGPGPYEGPVKVLAATPEEARERVDHYADLGYVQIKIYSSVKPELVPVIIDEAHKRGLRVSGHVPAGMTADQFVRDGADEIQHMNFVFLNFMARREGNAHSGALHRARQACRGHRPELGAGQPVHRAA